MQTEDSFFSLDKVEFKQMVDDVRKAGSSLGLDDFSLSKSKASSRWVRRPLYIASPIRKGEVFTAKPVRSVGPGLSLHPVQEKDIIGKVAKRGYVYGSRIDEVEISFFHHQHFHCRHIINSRYFLDLFLLYRS